MPWTFGDLRTFFHEDDTPNARRFSRLFEEMMRAHTLDPDGVEEVWLPYALEMLEVWPDHARAWENGTWFEERDPTLEGPHALHALGRFMYLEDVSTKDLLAYCRAFGGTKLVSLDFADFQDEVSASALAQALAALTSPTLRHLGLALMGLDDAHARVLLEATHLTGLTSMDVYNAALSAHALLELLEAPHLSNLRHLSFSDSFVHQHDSPAPDLTTQRQLMRLHPQLRTIILPVNAVPWHEQPEDWRDVPLPWEGKRVRERVVDALAMYRAGDEPDNQTYPFIGASVLCYGGYTELTTERFLDLTLTLEDVSPRAREVAQGPRASITSFHLAALQEGALDEAFDETGALTSTLEVRSLAKTKGWAETPPGRRAGNYDGAALLQTSFAKQGLCLDEDEDGVLRLTPEGFERDSALVRFCRAIHRTQAWVGGWIEDYVCSPWNEPLNGSSFHVDIRAFVVWEEHEHAFDERGALHLGQSMFLPGDVIALLRVLEGEGFAWESGRWANQVVLTDRLAASQPPHEKQT